MYTLLNKELPTTGFVYLNFSKLYGIGLDYALYLCGKIGLSRKAKMNHLSRDSLRVITRLLLSEGIFEFELLRSQRQDILNSMTLRTYKGLRHFSGLPVRGQRTKNNRKTARKLSFKKNL
ncbi:MAG: 30S ribosomal protein S13 [Bacteroidetes bacterium]|nr:30S ribosomal protein S13 [Bacteroidota bacterium]